MAPKKTNVGYAKATSSNLPIVNIEMLADFFNRTAMFVNNESSGVKASRSMGAKYGDDAVGRVQVKSNGTTCNIIADITPEHKIRAEAYTVTVDIDVPNKKIKKAECQGCLAALGGCKHTIAVIGWLHRRSEEPSPTEEACYWKKSALADIDITRPYDSDAMESSTFTDSEEEDADGFVSAFAAECEERSVECHFLYHYNFSKFSNNLLKASLHHLICDFLSTKQANSAYNFIKFCTHNLNKSVIQSISRETRDQNKSSLWHELRYGRITGSIVYEVAHCTTKDGSTIDKLFGKKTLSTKAMKRGRDLEPQVKLTVEELLKEKINDTGLWLRSDLPIFGASPDGIGPKNKYCVEIKCPSTPESYKTYVQNGNKIGKKFFAQMQLQMHFTNVKLTKFCVADPYYENNKKVDIFDVHYDENYVLQKLVKPCMKFWIENIYQKLCNVLK